MKTAMQELLEYSKWTNSGILITIPDELKEKVSIKIQELLEKEKNQLIFVMEQTAMYVSAASLDKDIGKMTFDDLYNQIFNQNK